MRKITTGKLFGLVSGLLLTTLLLSTTAWSAGERAGDVSQRFGGKKAAYRGAIEKTGFFTGLAKDRVTILEETSYRELSYIAGKAMIITFEDQPVDRLRLLPHSIVKLIVIDAEVVEIILLQESS